MQARAASIPQILAVFDASLPVCDSNNWQVTEGSGTPFSRGQRVSQLKIRFATAVVGIALAAFSIAGVANEQLENFIDDIDRLMSGDDLDAARQKIRQAKSLDIYDERLVILESRLRLLESLDTTPAFPVTGSSQAAANYLVNTIGRAVESRQIGQVSEVSEFSAQTRSLLNALYEQYSGLKVEVSYPLPNLTGNGFTSTLQIIELRTSEGDIAYPASAWSSHQIQVTKLSNDNLKAYW